MNDEQTNFERAESKMPVEVEKPSILEQAQNIPGLNAEFTQPVVKPAESRELAAERTAKPHTQTWEAPEPPPAKLGDHVARDIATDLAAQARGEISKLCDVKVGKV